MREELDLYGGRTGALSGWTPKQALDPKLCPVQITEGGRVTFVSQCPRKPKAGAVRPLRERFDDAVVEMEVCGLHAGVYDRRLKKTADDIHEKQVAKDGIAQMEAIAAELSELLGLTVKVETRLDQKTFITRPTGVVRIGGAELLDTLEEKLS